jgi:hypothetical protein
LHFIAQNVPWIAKDVNSCPLATVDDGKSDVTLIATQTGGGRCALTRYLLGSESGDFFNPNGQINQNLGMHYLKTTSWELDPHVKAFPPDEILNQEGFELDTNYEYNNDALYSIDGERYKS